MKDEELYHGWFSKSVYCLYFKFKFDFVGKAPCMSTLRCGPLMSWTDESAIKWRQEKSDKCHWLQLHLMRTLIFSGLRDPFHVINSMQLQTAEIILTDQIYYYSLLPREWKNSLYTLPWRKGRTEGLHNTHF